jgi:catechol 2,3-dioxygenase-like lactoylglutathione lyase family enzyme
VTSRIAVISVDARDPQRLARFWCDVLGWTVVEADDDGVSIGPSDGGWPTMDLLRVPDRKAGKNRLHLDLRAAGTTTEAELRRLRELGATPTDVGQGPDVSWVVLADPEGNEFCLLQRTVEQVTS